MYCLLRPASSSMVTWLQDVWEKPSSLHPSHIIRSVQTMLTTPVQVCRQPAYKSVNGMDLDSLLRLAAAFPA